MANTGLQSEFEYYLENQAELAKRYAGKVLVIKDHLVVGVYDSDFEAVTKASEQYEVGSFLVQLCEEGAAHRTFHSRVGLA